MLLPLGRLASGICAPSCSRCSSLALSHRLGTVCRADFCPHPLYSAMQDPRIPKKVLTHNNVRPPYKGGGWRIPRPTGLGQNVRRVSSGTLYTSGSHLHDRGSIIPHQVGGPACQVENLVEKDKNPEEWWPWKLDPRNGHCATPSQWSRRKSREISGIVTENTRF